MDRARVDHDLRPRDPGGFATQLIRLQGGRDKLPPNPALKMARTRTTARRFESNGWHFPLCVAKTHLSVSADPTLLGAPEGHKFTVNELRVAAGARQVINRSARFRAADRDSRGCSGPGPA